MEFPLVSILVPMYNAADCITCSLRVFQSHFTLGTMSTMPGLPAVPLLGR